MVALVQISSPGHQNSRQVSHAFASPSGAKTACRAWRKGGCPRVAAANSAEVAVIFESDDVMAIEKPPGIPYGNLEGRPGIIQLVNRATQHSGLGRVYG